MINGLGVVGWGVGGIEAEAGMLGQPVYFLTPEVVGVHMTGQLREGVTATDLVLHITQMLRAQKVVGKFVEFYGAGAASLPVPDRATIGNMAPEYGATMGFFPVDARVGELSARDRPHRRAMRCLRELFPRAEMFGMPRKGEIDYSVDLDLDLADVQPSVAGPKTAAGPDQSAGLGRTFRALLEKPVHGRRLRKANRSIFAKSMSSNLNGTRAARRRQWFRPIPRRIRESSPAKNGTSSRWFRTGQRPIRAKKSKPNRAKCSYMGRAASATAAS